MADKPNTQLQYLNRDLKIHSSSLLKEGEHMHSGTTWWCNQKLQVWAACRPQWATVLHRYQDAGHGIISMPRVQGCIVSWWNNLNLCLSTKKFSKNLLHMGAMLFDTLPMNGLELGVTSVFSRNWWRQQSQKVELGWFRPQVLGANTKPLCWHQPVHGGRYEKTQHTSQRSWWNTNEERCWSNCMSF